MLATLSHLSQLQLLDLAAITKNVINTVSLDKIVCYGSRTRINQDWSVFSIGESYKQVTFPTTYNLLIVPNKEEDKEEDELIQIIEQLAESLHYNVTVVIEPNSKFTESMIKGNRFINTVFANGLLLYDNEKGITSPEPVLPDMLKVINIAEQQWHHNMDAVRRFNNSADRDFHEKLDGHAMFNLHQCVQHLCMTLIKYFTGYKSTTNNLSRLFGYLQNFTDVFENIFPRNTDAENRLFTLLNKAFSDGRNKEKYSITSESALIINLRVQEMIVLAERLYSEQSKMNKEDNYISFPIKSPIENA